MSPDDDKDKPVKLTPDQMKRFKELGWGETPEEFDRRLQIERARLDEFENAGFSSGFIPSETPNDTKAHIRFNLSLDYFKDLFKRWFG